MGGWHTSVAVISVTCCCSSAHAAKDSEQIEPHLAGTFVGRLMPYDEYKTTLSTMPDTKKKKQRSGTSDCKRT